MKLLLHRLSEFGGKSNDPLSLNENTWVIPANTQIIDTDQNAGCNWKHNIRQERGQPPNHEKIFVRTSGLIGIT